MLETVVIVIHLLMALGLVVLVLLQHGKGADAGASLALVLRVPFSVARVPQPSSVVLLLYWLQFFSLPAWV